jgi:NAD(P)-dependent dehydrogenase (short-subunit alcohol dehydrogenase family)
VSRLAGRVCVVNGAASEIGQAVANRFASEGGVVAGVDKAAHAVGDHIVQADLGDEPQVEAMYEQVVRKYGRIDVIYNNMGLMDRGDHSVLDTSLETWRRVLDANLTSIFLSCKHGIPHLRNTDPAGGSVINAASFLAEIGAATAQMAYAAAKAGVVQLSRDLGVHLARSDVRVNAVLFGPIDSPHQRAVFDRNRVRWRSDWCTGRWGGSAPWRKHRRRSLSSRATIRGSSLPPHCLSTVASPKRSPCRNSIWLLQYKLR